MSATRSLAVAGAGVALVAAILWFVPSLATTATATLSPAAGEAVFTLLVFTPILLVAVGGGVLTGVRVMAAGAAPGRQIALGAALGLGGLLLATGYAAIAGTLHGGGRAGVGGALLLGIVTVTLQVLAEEALFRGWLQPLLARVVGLPAAVAGVAAAFALLHLLAGASGLVTLLNLALGGVLFGLLAARGGGIASAVAAHVGWNASEQLVLGLDPNPGVSAFGSLFDLDLVGALHWGGSADGLNASWAMAMALATIVLPLILALRRAR